LHPKILTTVNKKNNIKGSYGLGFVELFRGSEDLIKQRHTFYIKFLKNRNNILDIGCGRGEFIELLKKNGVDGIGIDIDKEIVRYCQKKHLKAIHADFQKYLIKQPDNYFGGISALQVIEHLSFNELISFFKLCFRKLSVGGILITETVNPHCLPAHKFFYIDPTHTKPLFPEVAKFLFISTGFQRVKLFYLHPVNPQTSMKKSHKYLQFECADYAILGMKQ